MEMGIVLALNQINNTLERIAESLERIENER